MIMKKNNKLPENTYDISLIIPVYNVKSTLKRCMDTVLKQNFENFEIILVDDGSTDGSSFLCDDYLGNEKVKVIHKENGGLGSARNAGIEAADGKYICFVDSDDYVSENYLSVLYNAIILYDSDFVISGYILKQNQIFTRYAPEKISGIYSGEEYKHFLLEFARGNSFLYFAWNKLYKRSLIVDNNLRYIDRHCAEDMMFNSQYFAVAHSVNIVTDVIYFYTVENINSLSNRRRNGFWNDMKLVMTSFQKNFEDKKNDEKYTQQVKNLILVLVRNTLSNYLTNEEFNLKESVSFIKNCCEDKEFKKWTDEIIPLGIMNRIVFFLIHHKMYVIFIWITRIKAFLKWHMFSLFSLIRSKI